MELKSPLPFDDFQIGVISLGTTAQDGTSRQVKVEILGIFDESTNMLRIRAIEPVTNVSISFYFNYYIMLMK